jgi:ABC-type dipeptide/oligopeptide/nickel transport system permease component
LVALAVSNTIHIKVSWVVGSSSVSLVWLVFSAAVISWLLGIVTGIMVHRRTGRPRESKSDTSRYHARP